MNEEIKRESIELPSTIAERENRPHPLAEINDLPSYSGALFFTLLVMTAAWYKGELPLLVALALALIATVFWASRLYMSMRDYTAIYEDGIIASRECNPFTARNARDWYQLPWKSILHLDLTRNCFAVLYDGQHGPKRLLKLKTMTKAERLRILTELRSYQQRGDIPSTVRIIDK